MSSVVHWSGRTETGNLTVEAIWHKPPEGYHPMQHFVAVDGGETWAYFTADEAIAGAKRKLRALNKKAG